jgi:hypothetical protein
MPSKSMLQVVYLLAAVLRIRPQTGGMQTTGLFLASSLFCYGASFGITALVLPDIDRKLAVLVLSMQYPILYILFSVKESKSLALSSVVTITLGYAVVSIGMFRQ